MKNPANPSIRLYWASTSFNPALRRVHNVVVRARQMSHDFAVMIY